MKNVRWEMDASTGCFHIEGNSDTMHGPDDKDCEPSKTLPKDLEGVKVCLKCCGGIGDVLMTIGGTAYALETKGCSVTAAVMDYQFPLMMNMTGVHAVIGIQQLNNPRHRRQFDVLIDFDRVFNRLYQLVADDYYKLVSRRVGLPVGPGQFSYIKPKPQDTKRKLAAVHTSASNPNRRWPERNWKPVIDWLVKSGYSVVFLGLDNDFGYESRFVSKLSDHDLNLWEQIKALSEADLFIGNDSGFAHVAGIYCIPGVVIFGNTHPDDVIARYPSLVGVHAFDDLGTAPPRTLKRDDKASRICLQGVTPGKVVDAVKKLTQTPRERG